VQSVRIDPWSTPQHRSEGMSHEMEWIVYVLALNTSHAIHETYFSHNALCTHGFILYKEGVRPYVQCLENLSLTSHRQHNLYEIILPYSVY
jgi:hypothetical protein